MHELFIVVGEQLLSSLTGNASYRIILWGGVRETLSRLHCLIDPCMLTRMQV